MSDTPFVGELRLMSFVFAPRGWAQCNGQTLPIIQNQALFSLLGTQYGGNGTSNFALPDLRGRAAYHRGPGFTQGLQLGAPTHALTVGEMPSHAHGVKASPAPGTQPGPGLLASAPSTWGPATDLTPLSSDTVASYGQGQGHENRPPSLVLNWCIALSGVFPSRS